MFLPLHRTPAPLALAIAAVTFAARLDAATPGAVLEEIIVTAQQREQSMADVPISMNVVGAGRIEAGNINKVADLVEFVPNLTMTETGASTQMYIRGIGSGNNQGFEQSVGQYVDGVYYGRQMLIRAPFFDLQRIEVLRGPQTTLFGKNTIAGALNYTTARPRDEAEFSVYALHEFESGQTELNAVASGALSDTLRARLAWRGLEEDGYIRNTLRGSDEPSRDENAVRLTVEWDASEALTTALKLERNRFDARGRQIEVVRDLPNLFPAGFTPVAGLNSAQILRLFGQPDMESRLDFKRQANTPEYNHSTMDNATLTVGYEFPGFTLSSITGHLQYDFHELCDCDFSPANTFSVQFGEDYEQTSQEFRLASPTGGRFEWLGGVFWQKSDMRSLEILDLPADSLIRTLAATSTDPARQALGALPGHRVRRDNGQSGETSALYFQGTWSPVDAVRLSLGGRYTREDKSGYRTLNALNLASLQPVTTPQVPLVLLGAFRIHTQQLRGLPLAPGVVSSGHDLSGDRKENQFTPTVIVEWDVNDQSMLYATATSGYKAGGFDGRANNPFSFEFEEERARSYEVGARNRWLDNRLEFNVAYFFTDYEDLQVSQFDGTFGFNAGNARGAEVQGIELDGRMAVTDELTASFSYAWLDFEFTDFRNGNCYNRQVPDGIVMNGVQMCDYTGRRGQYTPRHGVSLALDYARPLTQGFDFVASLMYNYRSSQLVHDNLDPNLEIDAVGRVNLRLGLLGERWRMGFIGKNLTDEGVLTYGGNVPLTSNIFGTNTFYGFVDRGRQLALELGYRL